MTSFRAASSNKVDTEGRMTDASAPNGLTLHPVVVADGPSPTKLSTGHKLQLSPLKPSNESLLEHYKYEKQSKGSSQSFNEQV